MSTQTTKTKNAKAGPGPSTSQALKNKKKRDASAGASGKKKGGGHAKKSRKLEEDNKLKALASSVANFTLSLSDQKFSDLPMSDLTKKGLKKAFFVDMTDIQAQSIPLSLKGRDVLGAARTGSGKTLAFLVPVLEALYRAKWGPQDGLGALILSPTRELAMQIFDVLRAIGGYHSFSAGLVIGGKNLKDESERLAKMNILVATPGRLLQHMDQTVGFDCDNLQILVLDEADRILDMGFSKALNAILTHLPKKRQTLLFSATQTDSVKDLARLSLNEPELVGTKEEGQVAATPKNLAQHYLVCDLPKKLDVLFSFIKTHLQAKVLVFLSSVKQVQFVFETFCKLHPGMPLLALHGKQKQTKRLDIFTRYTQMKSAVLFATDIAARGLDFPSVDWVLQVDAPEDADTYIHRVGRTARYDAKGQSLLFLLPSEEEGMLKELEAGGRGIKPEKIRVKESRTVSVREQLQSFAFQDPEIKYLGQRAFVSYVRSVHLHKNKDIFKVSELPLKDFAAALGLPGAPKVKFVTQDAANKKNAQHTVNVVPTSTAAASKATKDVGSDDEDSGSDDASESSDSEEEKAVVANDKPVVRTKYDRMFERKNQNILSEHYNKMIDRSDDESSNLGDLLGGAADGDDEDDFMTLKRTNHALPASLATAEMDLLHAENLSKRKARLLKTKKGVAKLYGSLGTKTVFDEEGVAHDAFTRGHVKGGQGAGEFEAGGADESVREAARRFAEKEKEKLAMADVGDKQLAKEKKQEKKRKRKEREAAERGDEMSSGAPLAYVEPVDEDMDDGYVSPTFDLPPADPDEDYEADYYVPPSKRARRDDGPSRKKDKSALASDNSLAADEELALKLLSGGA